MIGGKRNKKTDLSERTEAATYPEAALEPALELETMI
jgi:hypothetical protein